MNWPPTEPVGDDGSGGYYRDVHIANANLSGYVAYGIAMGSERMWVNCKFTGCKWGHRLAQANAVECTRSIIACLPIMRLAYRAKRRAVKGLFLVVGLKMIPSLTCITFKTIWRSSGAAATAKTL